MSEYRLPSGLASATNDCSGGYSLELSIPNKAKDRNLALHEAMEELLIQQERIKELENDIKVLVSQHDMWKQQWKELSDSLPKRDLEQQAKGIKFAVNKINRFYPPAIQNEQTVGYGIAINDFSVVASKLRKQAEELE